MRSGRFLPSLLAVVSAPALAATSPLIPLPVSEVAGVGSLMITGGTGIAVPAGDAGAERAARLLVARVAQERGLALTSGGSDARIRLVRDASVAGDEAYRLQVTPAGVWIAAAGDSGLLYGAMTLAQLLSPDAAFGRAVTLPAQTIADRPRFAWRGVMLDVARHYLPLPAIRTTIDQMAAHKLNTLHLHLTDDQGWRVEIKRYPDLTRIGAWRTPPAAGGIAGPPVGGFYTQAELRALVAYAAERGVTIVPEIDLPGHMQAAVAAYPDIGVLGDRPPVSHDWGVNPYLLMPDEHGVAFIERVLDELMDVFPSRFLHLGGDEAIKDQWQRSPAVQARMVALGLTNENAMQSWLIDRLGRYLADHGRRLIGWDEILEGGLPASASVMSWRGAKGAVAAAGQGHDVVLAPAPTLYLDSLQSDRGDEPPGRRETIVTLADMYRYDALPTGLDPTKADHVLGAEITAFSEYLVTPAEVQHAMFPRLDAFAEALWSPKATRGWAGFLDRLQPQRLRYARDGVAAADSAFAVGFALQGSRGEALRSGHTTVAMRTQSGYGTIRYTLDGRAPDAHSHAYSAPVPVPWGSVVRAVAFAPDGTPTAAVQRFDAGAAVGSWAPSNLVACPKGALGLRLPLTSEAVDGGPRYDVDLFNSCVVAPGVPQDASRRFGVEVARLPRNLGLAHDGDKVINHYAVTPFGELVMRSGGCEGPVVATFPLPDPALAANRLHFSGSLPAGTGDTDMCLLFTAPIAGPLYAIGSFRLGPDG